MIRNTNKINFECLPDLCDVGAAVGDGLGDLGAGDLVLLAAGLRQPGGGAGQRQEPGQEILQLWGLLDSRGQALRHRLHAVQGLGGLLREHLAAHIVIANQTNKQ